MHVVEILRLLISTQQEETTREVFIETFRSNNVITVVNRVHFFMNDCL